MRRFGQLDGKASLKGALGFLEKQDTVEDFSQDQSTMKVVWVIDRELDTPVLGPPDLQDKPAVVLVKTPTLALG